LRLRKLFWRSSAALCMWLASLFLTGAATVPLANESGLMAIEPVTFYFHFGSHFNRLVLQSSAARLWYSFIAADEDGPDTPLFIFSTAGRAAPPAAA